MHILIECMRLAFAEAKAHCADPKHSKDRCSDLLDDRFIEQQRQLIREDRAMDTPVSGLVANETVQFCAVDGEGNACSFIQSNYMGFGTGCVPRGCGFTLQNRGLNFELDPAHPNGIRGGKRPYHTIISGLLVGEDGEVAPFGVMGG